MKRHAPAALRNRQPILEVLRGLLREPLKVLEIASGSGEHAVFFAAALPHLTWQPSDHHQDAVASIEAHREEANLPNLLAPQRLDVCDEDWGPAGEAIGAILCINMIHIAPWEACQGLMAGAAKRLPTGAPLLTYGPYRFDGEFTASSNEAFDASLKARDDAWGVRDLSDVTAEAERHGLSREDVVALPANNHLIVFRRR